MDQNPEARVADAIRDRNLADALIWLERCDDRFDGIAKLVTDSIHAAVDSLGHVLATMVEEEPGR